MQILIKNMVCTRCILAVSQIFEEVGIQVKDKKIGYVVTRNKINAFKLDAINERLKKVGMEIINDQKDYRLNKIKNCIKEYTYIEGRHSNLKLSDFLKRKLELDYTYISSQFSSAEGITIEKYLIKLKIERAQIMLIDNQKKLNEIAWELGYPSVQHLSGQFKKITGITPTHFKKIMKQSYSEINK